jgi:hypothetical protein
MPQMMVSRETSPGSPSLSIFFQSEKCSQDEVTVPTFDSLPLERMMKALGTKMWGMVSR